MFFCKNSAPYSSCVVSVVAFTAVVSSALTATVLWLLKRNFSLPDVENLLVGKRQKRCFFEEKLTAEKTVSDAVYEADATAFQYMEFHYTPGSVSFDQKLSDVKESFSYPIRIAQKFEKFFPSTCNTNKRALDIGCATGASVLEMSKYFSSVIGVDYSDVFIHFANKFLKKTDCGHDVSISFTAPDQGDIVVNRTVSVIPGTFPERCLFYRADAMNLLADEDVLNTENNTKAQLSPSRYSDVLWYQVPSGERFDAVLAANLLCRVSDPRKLLDTFPRLLHKGGVLILSSPYSWWEGATSKENWIGGIPGGPRSEEAVKKILEENFVLLDETDEAFLIRDHVRRYQLGFAHCTVWRRS